MTSEPQEQGAFSHEAFLYPGSAAFLAGTLPFISTAVEAGHPVLVVVSAEKIDLLRHELGAAAGKVDFADMAGAGGNPGRLIGMWRRFAAANRGARQLRAVGEAVYPGRSPAELAGCQRYEEVLNVAFDNPAPPLRLMCPYDVTTLPAGVTGPAKRAHPFLTDGTGRERSASYQPPDLSGFYTQPLPPGPDHAAGLAFTRGELGRLRAFVAAQARDAGLAERSASALVAAVNEIATNSLQHGGGQGELRVWTDGDALLCEVTDRGYLTEPLAGRLPPAPDQGAGLWLANQLTDLVEIHSAPGGTTVRVRQKL